MDSYQYVPLNENVEEMFIGPFGSSLKNDDFVEVDDAFCMVYEQKHAIKKTMDVETRYVSRQKYEELKRFNIKGGDIIVSCRGTIGETFIVPDNAPLGIMHPSIMKIRLKPGVYNKHYFNLLLRNHLKQHEDEANGSGVKMAISAKELGATMFPVPGMEEQERISDIFEQVDKLIVLRKEQLAKLDQLVKSRFVEMFGDPILNPMHWATDTAEHHIDLLSGYPFDSTGYVDIGIHICGGLIIMPQRINWNECKYWKSTDGFETYMLQEADIVMALDRPWISEGFKIAQIDEAHLPALLIQRTARIRAVDLNQSYLFHCFLHGGFDAHCNVTGSLVPHISAKDIRSFKIMLPPIELQNTFAAFVEQTNKSKLTIQASLDKLELLKKSLMQQYFG